MPISTVTGMAISAATVMATGTASTTGAITTGMVERSMTFG
jgi:hypothetical protein